MFSVEMKSQRIWSGIRKVAGVIFLSIFPFNGNLLGKRRKEKKIQIKS
jgi:hypothetical protein